MRRSSNIVRTLGISAGLGLAGLAVASSPAFAQDNVDPDPPAFDLRTFSPTAGPHGTFSTEHSAILDHLTFAVRAIADYANEPLTAFPNDQKQVLVDGIGTLNIAAAFGLFDYGELGLVIPFVMLNDGTFNGTALEDNTPGDIHVRAKVRALRNEDFAGFGLSGLLDLGIPVGDEAQFTGDGGVTFRVAAIADYVLGPITIATNLGATFRGESVVRNITKTHDFDYKAGVDWQAVEGLLVVSGEIFGTFPLSSAIGDSYHTPAEWLLGTKFQTPADIHFTLAAGTGLNDSVGSPRFHVVAGLEYAPLNPDRDGDEIVNSDDSCPDLAEDRDGFQDEDGCPEADNDEDGFADADDTCPDEPEDVDGFQDEDGCPDPDTDEDGIPDAIDACVDEPEDIDGFEDEDGCRDPDNDNDFVADTDDQCPDEPEDIDKWQDGDGCPDPDNDGDGIPDETDRCHTAAEDMDGFEDTDGCPDFDNDKDGVLDADDQCPTEAEVINGVDDADGCPDEGKVLVIVSADKIDILDKVFFETGKSLIKPESYSLLNQVAQTIQANDQLTKIRVEGHTDDVGDDTENMKLSQDRAQAVVDYLTAQGVGADRLEPVGYGETRPVKEGTGKKARAANRRVEFVIVQ